MKIAHYILALYTLLLSCIPCQDAAEFVMNEYAQDIVSASHDRQSQDEPDLCSPFCICACCSGITLQPSVAGLPDVEVFSFPQEKTFTYSNRAGSGDLKSIWQPPRV